MQAKKGEGLDLPFGDPGTKKQEKFLLAATDPECKLKRGRDWTCHKAIRGQKNKFRKKKKKRGWIRPAIEGVNAEP